MKADMVSINKQFLQAFDQSIKPLLAHFGIDAPDIMISDLVLDSRDVAIQSFYRHRWTRPGWTQLYSSSRQLRCQSDCGTM